MCVIARVCVCVVRRVRGFGIAQAGPVAIAFAPWPTTVRFDYRKLLCVCVFCPPPPRRLAFTSSPPVDNIRVLCYFVSSARTVDSRPSSRLCPSPAEHHVHRSALISNRARHQEKLQATDPRSPVADRHHPLVRSCRASPRVLVHRRPSVFTDQCFPRNPDTIISKKSPK